jgi:hypothetical protein
MHEAEAHYCAAFERIGSFLFHFSQLEFTIRHFLATLLKLKDKQFDVITAPYDFVTLCSVAEAIAVQEFQKQAQIIENYFKSCKGLNNSRVKVAHGLWLDNGATLTARHVSRQSLKASYYFDDQNELAVLCNEAKRLMAELIEGFRLLEGSSA